MLLKIRGITKGTGAYVLLFLIGVPLSFFGFSWFQGSEGNKTIAEVNGEAIIENDLLQRLQQELQAAAARGVDIENVDISDLRTKIVRVLAAERVFTQFAERWQIAIPEDLARQEIVKREEFHEGGNFSGLRYESYLEQSGHTGQSFIESLQRQLLFKQILSPYLSGSFFTPRELESFSILMNEERDARVLVMSLQSEIEKIRPQINDDQIAERYLASPGDFLTEDEVIVEYLEFKQEDLFPLIEITEEEIVDLYDRERERLDSERRISHILLEHNQQRSESEATQILSDLRARVISGESFGQLAAEYSEDIGSNEDNGSLGLVEEGYFEDEEVVEEVVQNLQYNEVSKPVRSSQGWHIFYRQENEIAELAERRDEIRLQLLYEKSSSSFLGELQRVSDQAFGSSNLDALKFSQDKDSSLTVAFTRKGLPEGPFADSRLVEVAFSEELLAGELSRILRVNAQTAYIFKVVEYFPVRVMEQDEARDRIIDELAKDSAKKILSQGADEALNQITESFSNTEAVAAQWNSEWEDYEKLRRDDEILAAPVRQHLFTMPIPAPGSALTDKLKLENGDIALLILLGVTSGDKVALTDADADDGSSEEREQEQRLQTESQLEQLRSDYGRSISRFLEVALQSESSIEIFKVNDDEDSEQ